MSRSLPILVVFELFMALALVVPKPVQASDSSELRAHLRSQYPELTAAQFNSKLSDATSAHDFFRAFAPYFYETLAKHPLWKKFSASAFSGWCAGDAHIGNFGSQLLESGGAMFTINDIDDGSQCPLLADWLRLAVSSRLGKVDVDASELLSAYREGLSGKSHELSEPVRALLEDATAHGKRPKKKDVADGGSRLERGADEYDLDNSQLKMVRETLSRAYGADFEFKEALGFKRDHGGSAGEFRIRALALISGDLQVIELKEEPRPATFPLTSAQPAFATRLTKTLESEQPRASRLIKAVRMNDRDFLARPRWRGNDSIDVDACVGHPKIVLDEAYALGRAHRATAPAGYSKSLASLDPSALEKLIEELKGAIKGAHDLLSN